MELKALLSGVGIRRTAGGNPDIKGISPDSRNTKPGDIFIAVRGGHADGNAFIKDALGKGAAAVVTEHIPAADQQGGAAFVEVPDSKDALARIAANFYGNPSQKLPVTGITGTNGKTTTSFLIYAALRALGKKPGLIGTISYIINGVERPAPYTTPEAPEFQSMLSAMLGAGATHAVSEVSSHALAQRRVDGTGFKAAVFTNLTRDHLDFHKTMDEYYEAKKRLFSELLDEDGAAVINIDDPYGRRLAGETREKRRVLTYALENHDADIRAEGASYSTSGVVFDITYRGGRFRINSKLAGAHNVYNILAASGALLALGFSPEEAVRGTESLTDVKGRFEKVDCGQDFLVIVDYAHSPDALERLITAARAISKGRIITVFGCGGDRDRGKRPQMGSIAASLSDLVIITSDNPRSEDPVKIIEDVAGGAAGGNCRVVPDRAEAIKQAIDAALPGDTVLIAGKGHEDYQIVNGRRHFFSDQLTARDAIRGKAGGQAC
ncbi:MAG: UDP-N-acetylmuramoyl-L-alanyl-D-glutamate--2,6-diaminopimelate ligase [Nitrospiraceae bacterium]|nr:UDP-N-acetylmuramoyl-L-alanyl-D-glutamate--2,6-diaminopimelate ligase [Nitrospiraceae bacterium]